MVSAGLFAYATTLVATASMTSRSGCCRTSEQSQECGGGLAHPYPAALFCVARAAPACAAPALRAQVRRILWSSGSAGTASKAGCLHCVRSWCRCAAGVRAPVLRSSGRSAGHAPIGLQRPRLTVETAAFPSTGAAQAWQPCLTQAAECRRAGVLHAAHLGPATRVRAASHPLPWLCRW